MSAITDEMWYFWTEFKKIEPTVELGGIYADKPGYHNTRAGNSPSNYSVVLPPDKLGPSDKAAAIDLTFPNAQSGNYTTIAKYSSRLLKSGKDPNDPRGNYLREFFGNADSDTQVEGWDFYYATTSTSDSSHLWHIHISFLRKYVTSLTAMNAVLSILKGETYAEYLQGGNVADYTEGQMRAFPWQYVGAGIGENESDGTMADGRPNRSMLAYVDEILRGVRALQSTTFVNTVADAVVAKLPPAATGGLTADQVKEAVKQALREGTV